MAAPAISPYRRFYKGKNQAFRDRGVRFIDRTGEKRARWTCVKFSHIQGGVACWVFKCDCGTIRTLRGNSVWGGQSKSCGCWRVERSRAQAKANIKHDLSRTRLYRIYTGMLTRCYDDNDPGYKNYGARGIMLCLEWLSDRTTFFKWAMENGYDALLQIDRIDPDGHYEPLNCRWVTSRVNQNNRRNNVVVVYGGKKITISDLARQERVPERLLRKRIARGWDIESALRLPSQYKRRVHLRLQNIDK